MSVHVKGPGLGVGAGVSDVVGAAVGIDVGISLGTAVGASVGEGIGDAVELGGGGPEPSPDGHVPEVSPTQASSSNNLKPLTGQLGPKSKE